MNTLSMCSEEEKIQTLANATFPCIKGMGDERMGWDVCVCGGGGGRAG